MSDHKLLHQSVPGADADTTEASAAPGPAAPVPLPVRRTPDGGTEHFDFEQPTRPRAREADPVAGGFDFHQATRPRRSKEDGPALPPRPGNELDNLDNYKHSTAKAKKVLGIDDGQLMETPVGKFSAESTATKRAEVAKVKAGETTPNVHQPVADLGEIYAHCGMIEAEYKHQVQMLAKASKGKATFRPAGKMKSIGRTLEKMMADYSGDPSRLVDLTGGSISFDTADDLVKAYGLLRSYEIDKPDGVMFKVVRVKNSLVKGKGYGDINLSIEMGGADFDVQVGDKLVNEHYPGFIIELQLHMEPIIAAKEQAHKPYEGMRSIEARNKEAGKGDASTKAGWSDPDKAEYEDLDTKMKQMYGDAWAALGDVGKFKTISPMSPR